MPHATLARSVNLVFHIVLQSVYAGSLCLSKRSVTLWFPCATFATSETAPIVGFFILFCELYVKCDNVILNCLRSFPQSYLSQRPVGCVCMTHVTRTRSQTLSFTVSFELPTSMWVALELSFTVFCDARA